MEFDAEELFQRCYHLLNKTLSEQYCQALTLTNQRASSVVFDPVTAKPVSNGLSWQDLRTAPMCLALKEKNIFLSPNQSATKIALLMDLFDPDRSRGLFGGTIDAWIAFRLTGNFVTDHTNAAMTGLVEPTVNTYDEHILRELRITRGSLPEIKPSIGFFGDALLAKTTLPLVSILGDQQASMIGQGITVPGRAKATFGTGAMIDTVTGSTPPNSTRPLSHGTFPIVARSDATEVLFGLEAIGLHAGSAVQYACSNLGLASDPSDLERIASNANDSPYTKELFVPALTGLGTPHWDFGALGVFVNLTAASTKNEVAHAVLSGIAHQGADLIEAIERDSGCEFDSISVDGGMTKNTLFLKALSSFSGKRLTLSTSSETTTTGSALAGFMAYGVISDVIEIDHLMKPQAVIEPSEIAIPSRIRLAREHWSKALRISRNSVPELSSVSF